MAQEHQAVKLGSGHTVAYTPSGANVAAGEVVIQGSLIGVATQPIKDGELGSICIDGRCKVVKGAGSLTTGSIAYWNPSADPQVGPVGTGAAEGTPGAGAVYLGLVTEGIGPAGEYVEVRLRPSYSS